VCYKTGRRPFSFKPGAREGEVADVEDYHEQIKKQKIKPTTPLTEQWWGDRTFTVLDPFGYQIWFYQNVAEPKLPAGAKVV
jgi:uncharacterized glyoxalase superfamily protein PhnB